MTEIRTPEFALRIRLTKLPDQEEFYPFDLRHFRAGGVFVVPARLASMLILAGCAELLDDHPARSEAADFGQPKFPRRK